MAVDSSAAETKQQGIIETAQAAASDPQSKIQPELVEQKLVEESRKAGAVAYQFNPNDSPEEKAKAANAVSSMILPAFKFYLARWLICIVPCRTFIPISTVQINKKVSRWYQIKYEQLLFHLMTRRAPNANYRI